MAQSAPSSSASQATPAGTWSGAIEVPGQRLEVRVTLRKAANGWQGTIDIPAQGAKALALEAFTVEGAKVTFRIGGVGGNPTFHGELSADGKAITGEFSQGGGSFPFSLGATTLPSFDDLQGWLDATREKFHVPGCAVAIVKDGEPLAMLVSGLRDVDRKLPVTPDTLFAIGSSTKAFTTLLLATLVDENKLEWDKPVRTWIPDFALMEAGAGEHLTPRDLVTHRSGMPRHDLVWYGREFDRADMVARLRYLPLNKDLRTEFQYNNLMLLTAGHLAERIAGHTWEELVTERIFLPLGMMRSNFSVKASAADADHAEPYRYVEKKLEPILFRDITAIGPAGSINSTVREMAQWVALHLQNGKRAERVVVQPASLADLHRVRMPIPDSPSSKREIVSVGYALGWFVDVYRGSRRIHHGGNIDGFSAEVAFLPDTGYGFVVLTNLNGTPIPELVVRRLADRALGLEAKDFATELGAKRDQAEAAAKLAKRNESIERKTGTKPSHPLEDYVGEYAHKGYGTTKITPDGERLHLELHSLKANAEHWHYDVFRCMKDRANPELEGLRVQFTTNLDGDIDALHVALEPATEPITFERQADSKLRDPKFLQRLAGDYVLSESTAVFALRGDKLTVALPGQFYVLEPRRALEFDLKGLRGYSVRFVLDQQGEPISVRFRQPDGVFVHNRKPMK